MSFHSLDSLTNFQQVNRLHVYLCAHMLWMYSKMCLAVDFCYKWESEPIVPKLKM